MSEIIKTSEGRPVNGAEVRPFSELRDTGLLWLINRVVFHPRGYGLALAMNQKTGEIDGWAMIGDGEEPYTFDDSEPPTETELFNRVEGFFFKTTIMAKQKELDARRSANKDT